MKKKTVFAALLILPMVGCANQFHGAWIADGPAPEGSPCTMNRMEFKDDATFSANAVVESRPMDMAGKWKYEWGKLKLETSDGKTREYDATVWWFKTLEMKAKHEGKTFTQKFKKEEAAS
ncbi:MAG: hypothetical protein HUU22_08405 [Phycisphaerae bacterium]|nr:hypothetical protein [Phycisphaerae bacterium]NUQ46041.1 hypothetical protein [Phycisphaerae bacterium]